MRYLFSNRALFTSAVIMCICFVAGVVLGTVCAAYDPVSELMDGQIAEAPFGAVLVNVFTYPTIALLLGLSIVGVIAIPLLMAVRGFLLSFAVAALAKSFGLSGILYALGLFGVQCLLVLPCLLYIASHGFITSSALFALAARKGKKVAVFTRDYAYGMLITIALLVVAAVAETLLTPALCLLISGVLR